ASPQTIILGGSGNYVIDIAPQGVQVSSGGAAVTTLAVNEGDAVSLVGSFNNPNASKTYTYDWSVTASNGQVIADGHTANFSFVPVDNGTYLVTFSVADNLGGTS